MRRSSAVTADANAGQRQGATASRRRPPTCAVDRSPPSSCGLTAPSSIHRLKPSRHVGERKPQLAGARSFALMLLQSTAQQVVESANAARAVCRRHRSARRCATNRRRRCTSSARKRGGVSRRTPGRPVSAARSRCIEAGQQRRRQQCRQVAGIRPGGQPARASGQPALVRQADIALVGVARHRAPRLHLVRVEAELAASSNHAASAQLGQRRDGAAARQHQTLTRAHLVHQRAQRRREVASSCQPARRPGTATASSDSAPTDAAHNAGSAAPGMPGARA